MVIEEISRATDVYNLHSGSQPISGRCQLLATDEVSWLATSDACLFTNSACSYNTQLPIDVLLKIFSYLDVRDNATVSLVCHQWHDVWSSDFIWNPKLQLAMRNMTTVFHDRNPLVFCRVSNLSCKHIYSKCIAASTTKISALYRVPQMLRNLLLPRKVSRIVMFGPGLETRTSRLVRSMLNDDRISDVSNASPSTSKFHVTGLVAAPVSGIGSGISLRLNQRCFDLVTLYSNIESLRRNLSAFDRVRRNRLFVIDTDENEQFRVFQLTPPIQEVCRLADAFIFVVDAMQTLEQIALSSQELHAILSGPWCSAGAPLLVLCCFRNSVLAEFKLEANVLASASAKCVQSCVDIVDVLRLGRLNQKWLAQAAEVDLLEGVREGISWQLQQI